MKDKVVLAYSGGLDTSYCCCYLSKERDLEVHAILVDTGGFNSEELSVISDNAFRNGATAFESINAVQDFYLHCIRYLIFGNVLRNQTYPLSVSAERIFQAHKIIEYAKSIGAKYIAHGSTGAGNDQVRFDMNIQILAPDIKIITPIRDLGLSREEEIQYLQKHGIQMDIESKDYSINQGLWGTSVGGKETLTSHLTLPETAYPSQLKNSEPQQVRIEFSEGELSAVNGLVASPVECIQKLNELASAFAIGRGIHVGDTIMGIKGRVGFEAGGPLLIIKAHQLLEKHVLTSNQQYWKDQIGNWYGMKTHEGFFLEPTLRHMEQFLLDSQKRVTGIVHIKLMPYQFELVGIESPYDLMKSKYGLYGEKNTLWSSDQAKGFIQINAVPLKIYHNLEHE